MSFDDPKAYHREWKAKHDGSAATLAIGCLSLSLLIPGGALVLAIPLFLIFGTTTGFVVLLLLLIVIFGWQAIGESNTYDNRRRNKLQELAKRSLEANVCPNCGEYAFPEDTSEDGWWRCRECIVEISPKGNAQFRYSKSNSE
jgi:ribosomal protein L37AE/L43A